MENSEQNTHISDSCFRSIALTAPRKRDQETEQIGVYDDGPGKTHEDLDYDRGSQDHAVTDLWAIFELKTFADELDIA